MMSLPQTRSPRPPSPLWSDVLCVCVCMHTHMSRGFDPPGSSCYSWKASAHVSCPLLLLVLLPRMLFSQIPAERSTLLEHHLFEAFLDHLFNLITTPIPSISCPLLCFILLYYSNHLMLYFTLFFCLCPL